MNTGPISFAKREIRKLLVLMVALLVLILFITTVAAAGSKNYNGLTTINYYNQIVNISSSTWNARVNAYTSPSYSMDQLGTTVWTTYITCNGATQWGTVVSYQSQPWMMGNNVTSYWDTMARSKFDCGVQTRRGVNYAQYWWQDGGYAGDGDSEDISSIL